MQQQTLKQILAECIVKYTLAEVLDRICDLACENTNTADSLINHLEKATEAALKSSDEVDPKDDLVEEN
jgi:16S rRNA C1402 (ribose-2'-O) methylase RsmI